MMTPLHSASARLRGHTRPMLAALCACACACGTRHIPVNVRLVTNACAPDPRFDPLDGAAQLRFTVYGPGLDSSQTTRAAVSSQHLSLPEVPPGTQRQLLVEALSADERVLARGESERFDVLDTGAPEVTITLRRADAFTPAPGRAESGACAQLLRPRAGHTATRLSDGRVLIAGGFTERENGATVYESSTELYDPRTGEVSQGPWLAQPRAFHTATVLPGRGKVLLAGGEAGAPGTSLGALRMAEIFDEGSSTLDLVLMGASRSRHAAAGIFAGGRVLIVGGRDQSGEPMGSTEEFDPATGKFSPGPDLDEPRGEAAAVVSGDGRIVVVGGRGRHGALASAVLFLAKPDGAWERSADWKVELASGRIAPRAQALIGLGLVVSGGFATHEGENPFASALDTLELIDLDQASSSLLPQKDARRGYGGIAPLLDGSVLVVGGAAAADGAGVPSILASATILSPAEKGLALRPASSDLLAPRYLAQYTPLLDGTVLVSGGALVDVDGKRGFAAALETFQPRYRASAESPYR